MNKILRLYSLKSKDLFCLKSFFSMLLFLHILTLKAILILFSERTFIANSQTTDDVYENLEDYNQSKKKEG